ncbi:hypothetical protein [Phocaeicola massiliensis]|jgi:hypothetical protein|uniref:hypothetical protein n=1 Tax=Phocaeicola massiliensis TaxID=204516 RepID=UPI00189717C8|nr:hypothetical protein [Phocaeicola massiliensis]
MKKKIATVEIECSNSHLIPTFSDFLNELQKRFDIEKDCKNEAYSFIIANGLYEDFREFCKNYKGVDHYKAIIGMLITDAEIKQIKK